jgi:hypothetical protein
MSSPLSGASTDIVPGVSGTNSGGGVGVLGISNAGNGIYGNSDTGNGVYGTSASGKAGYFQGDVTITRDLTAVNAVLSGNLTADDVLLSGKDCAEEFATANRGELDPGTVVVINAEGRVCQTAEPYNKRGSNIGCRRLPTRRRFGSRRIVRRGHRTRCLDGPGLLQGRRFLLPDRDRRYVNHVGYVRLCDASIRSGASVRCGDGKGFGLRERRARPNPDTRDIAIAGSTGRDHSAPR